MPIVPRRPLWDIDRFFEDDWPEWPRMGLRRRERAGIMAPRMDVYDTGKEIVAELELPGVDPKNIDIEVRDNFLSVEAKKEEKKEEKGKGYYRKEISSGFYKRAVPLPAEVIADKTEAVCEGGVLRIKIPKKKPERIEEEKGVKIKVKTA